MRLTTVGYHCFRYLSTIKKISLILLAIVNLLHNDSRNTKQTGDYLGMGLFITPVVFYGLTPWCFLDRDSKYRFCFSKTSINTAVRKKSSAHTSIL